MKPQRQLIEHCPEEGRYGDCQRACVAAILDMDAECVPHFCAPPHADKGSPDHWEARQNAWLAERGLATMTVAYDGQSATFEQVMEWTSEQSPAVPMILAGRSRLGSNHVVVVLNGEIVCDPSGNGIVGPTKENTWEVSCLAAIEGVCRAPMLLTEEDEDTIGEWCTGGSSVPPSRLASVGRNGNRQDRGTGLGPKGEHAVAATGGETPSTSHTGGSHG